MWSDMAIHAKKKKEFQGMFMFIFDGFVAE